ncbi:MAG: hypothetical protein KAH20_06685 [Methylococcales bacterium]|nr:hypothetical protein [Methylococcales bacterium]
MDINTAKEVIACLPEGKTVFNYYKDRYAAFILSQVIGEECAIADLKQSAFSGLLNKSVIKDIVSKSGNGKLQHEQLEMAWGKTTEPFLLTLDTWGHKDRDWDQVSRNGYNLVLQLNFSNKHDAMFRKQLKPETHHSFKYWDHPVMKQGERALFRETLAWARIDFDFKTNEALIEELQTDWLRIARCLLRQIDLGRTQFRETGFNTTTDKLKTYLQNVLLSYGKIWDEAMLMATIQFIHLELGIDNIFLHTPESGAAVKKIKDRLPPRSLYSSLPKKFCFSQTDKAPEFLCKNRAFRKLEKKLGGTRWNIINLGGNDARIH